MWEESAHEALKPRQVFGRRVREARKRRGLRQQDVADRLRDLGHPIDRSTIAKIERGQSRADASISDVLAFAAALGVAPVHLIVPTDDEGKVAVTPKRELDVAEARRWIRGYMPADDADVRAYLLEMPESEARHMLRAFLLSQSAPPSGPLSPLARLYVSDKINEATRRLLDTLAEATP